MTRLTSAVAWIALAWLIAAAAPPLPAPAPADAPEVPAPHTNTIRLTWWPAANASGYVVGFGPAPWTHTNAIATDSTLASVSNLSASDQYWFAVKATNESGESEWSNAVPWPALPLTNQVLTLQVLASTNLAGPWLHVTNVATFTNPPGDQIFKLAIRRDWF